MEKKVIELRTPKLKIWIAVFCIVFFGGGGLFMGYITFEEVQGEWSRFTTSENFWVIVGLAVFGLLGIALLFLGRIKTAEIYDNAILFTRTKKLVLFEDLIGVDKTDVGVIGGQITYLTVYSKFVYKLEKSAFRNRNFSQLSSQKRLGDGYVPMKTAAQYDKELISWERLSRLLSVSKLKPRSQSEKSRDLNLRINAETDSQKRQKQIILMVFAFGILYLLLKGFLVYRRLSG